MLAAACKQGKRDLLVRLLDAGARVPPVLTDCRSYLLSDPDMLRLLLESGMDPDLPDWLLATPLHDLCGRDSRGRPHRHRAECATILLDAGADISAKDEDYRSTPLAWAARNDLPDMVELLLARGAADEPPRRRALGHAARLGDPARTSPHRRDAPFGRTVGLSGCRNRPDRGREPVPPVPRTGPGVHRIGRAVREQPRRPAGS